MNKLHVKTGDTVQIMVGKDKGNRGKILQVSKQEGKVIVEGQNMAQKHVRPVRQGQLGGIVSAEAPLYASKVMPVCPKCNQPTRIGYTVGSDGDKVRVCKRKDCDGTF